MIVVTTPTGNIGSQVLQKLLAANEEVRVIARDVNRLSKDVRERVEVVEGSHSDAAIVSKAFQNAAAVFWVVPPNPMAQSVEAAYVDFSRAACEVFRTRSVLHVVGVSSLGRGKPQAENAGPITASLHVDDLIAATGVNYRALVNPSFMDNILRQVATIKSDGVFSSPTPGDLRAATCATRDIAAAAAELLTHRTWSGPGEFPVLGPEDLSFNDMAKIMSETLAKPIRFEEMSSEAMKSALLGRGRSEAMAQGVVDMMVAVKEGIYSDEPRNPITASPTTFRQWCEEVLKPAVIG